MSERVRAPGRGGGGRRHMRRLCYISVNRCSCASHTHTHHSTPPTPPRPSSDLQLVSRLLAACTFPEKKKSSPTVHDPQGVTVSVSRDWCSQAEPSVSAANHASTFALCSAVFGLFVRLRPSAAAAAQPAACSQDVAVRGALHAPSRTSPASACHLRLTRCYRS